MDTQFRNVNEFKSLPIQKVRRSEKFLNGILEDGDRVEVRWPDGDTTENIVIVYRYGAECYDNDEYAAYILIDYHGDSIKVSLRTLDVLIRKISWRKATELY